MILTVSLCSAAVLLSTALGYSLGRGKRLDPDLVADVEYFQRVTNWSQPKSIGKEIGDLIKDCKRLEGQNAALNRVLDLAIEQEQKLRDRLEVVEKRAAELERHVDFTSNHGVYVGGKVEHDEHGYTTVTNTYYNRPLQSVREETHGRLGAWKTVTY